MPTPNPTVTESSELKLYDGTNNVVAHLFVDGAGFPQLHLKDQAGTVRVKAGLSADGTPSVELLADNGIGVLSLAVSPGPRGVAVPSVVVKAPDGQYDLVKRVDDLLHGRN